MIVYDAWNSHLQGAGAVSMRWVTFFILLYLMAALQISKLGGIPSAHAQGAIWPYIEFLPLLAVFYALYAADSSAPMAALFCGLIYDLRNLDLIGTNLIPLALVAWVILRIRLSIFREHFVSQVIISLLAVLAFGTFSAIFRRLIGASLEGGSMWTHMAYVGGNAVYSAIVAPPIFFVLFRFQHLLGFTPHGPRTRGHI